VKFRLVFQSNSFSFYVYWSSRANIPCFTLMLLQRNLLPSGAFTVKYQCSSEICCLYIWDSKEYSSILLQRVFVYSTARRHIPQNKGTLYFGDLVSSFLQLRPSLCLRAVHFWGWNGIGKSSFWKSLVFPLQNYSTIVPYTFVSLRQQWPWSILSSYSLVWAFDPRSRTWIFQDWGRI
jgi:hypothetical protein